MNEVAAANNFNDVGGQTFGSALRSVPAGLGQVQFTAAGHVGTAP